MEVSMIQAGVKFRLTPYPWESGETYDTVYNIDSVVDNAVNISWEGCENPVDYDIRVVEGFIERGTWEIVDGE